MHFVHVEDFIHPDAGYQLNLLSKIQVEQGHEVTIVTSELKKIPNWLTAFFGKDNIEEKDEKFFRRTGVKIIRVPLMGFYSGRSIYYPGMFKVVDDLKPDVLFVHGEDTLMGMQFIWRSAKQKYPMVLDCHMVEMASENRFRHLFRVFYKAFVTPIIIRRQIPLIRVVDSDYVEKCLGLPLNKTVLLSFGTDTNFFKPSTEASDKFRAEHGIAKDDFVILYAGKLDVYKGGQFLAETIQEKLITSTGKKIVFVIVGNIAGEYGKRVEELFEKSENTILRFPTQTYSDLSSFYQAANLAIYPRQCSMSFFEAQSCGLPVVFENNEINDERVKFGNGFTFIPENPSDFREKLLLCAEMEKDKYDEMRVNAREYIIENFNYVPIAQKFTDVMISEYHRFHGLNSSKKSINKSTTDNDVREKV